MRMKTIAVLLPLAVAACASSPTVHTDFDSRAQFGSYKTYSWSVKPELGSPLAQQRIVEGIERRLQAKGLVQVASEGDLAVAAHVASQQKTTLDTLYTGTGMGGWGWHGGWAGGLGVGSATTQVRNYQVGTLIVDLFDAQSKQAIWRGTASGTVSSNPDTNRAAVEAGLDKMFANYPPDSTANATR